jgi:hypothetical protein
MCEQVVFTDYYHLLIFTDVIQLLAAETNKHYDLYPDTLENDSQHSQLPDVTLQGIMYFWLLSYKEDTIHRTYCKITGQQLKQLYMPFYSNMIKSD